MSSSCCFLVWIWVMRSSWWGVRSEASDEFIGEQGSIVIGVSGESIVIILGVEDFDFDFESDFNRDFDFE